MEELVVTVVANSPMIATVALLSSVLGLCAAGWVIGRVRRVGGGKVQATIRRKLK